MRVVLAACLLFALMYWTRMPLLTADQSTDQTVQALADYRLQHARVRVAQACREIEEETAGQAWCRTPIRIVEWPTVLMPPGVLGMTEMDGGGTKPRTCRLTFTSYSIQDNETLAHEACHCAWDGEVIGDGGWGLQLTEEEREKREKRAKACGKEKGSRP